MKKINKKLLLLTAVFTWMAGSIHAQENVSKADKLTFMKGSVKTGKVLAFAGNKVQFIHNGETLNYEFAKTEIEKIEYASGRTEIITEKKETPAETVKPVTKNKVAVIPLQYTGYGKADRGEDMSFYLQEITNNFLSKSAAELKFTDLAEINATLLKNGINDDNIRKYTPKELAALLHVEYVIMGSVLQEMGNKVTRTSGDQTRKYDNRHATNEKRRESYSESTVTNQMIETNVSLSIYNETGEKIYGKTRQSLLAEKDAYKNTLHYLLKRTPLYKR